MRRSWLGVLAVIGFVALSMKSGSAAPPSSCAQKFVGTWVYSGGTTVIASGGMAYPKCPMCVATQTWTCQGNTYLFSNSGPPGQFSATLSPDGRQMFGSGTVATRVGGASKTASKPKEQTAKTGAPSGKNEKQLGSANQQKKEVGAKSASCSDITGTSSKAPAATHCQNADRALYAARQVKQSNPQIAATEFKKAAIEARAAGDTNLELSILREASDAASAVIVALPQPAPIASISPLPSVSAQSQVPTQGMRTIWDGSFDKCNTASPLEQNTASWYMTCVTPPEKISHTPNPEPKMLGKQARDACGSYTRDTSQCFADFKLKFILASNPGLRETCETEAKAGSALRREVAARLKSDGQDLFRQCVDNIYLYGHPDRSSDEVRRPLRDMIKDGLNQKSSSKPENPNSDAGNAASGPRSALCGSQACCPSGFGMQPTPGAFGAWSCQPLGLLTLKAVKDAPLSQEEREEIADFENRIDSLLANAVLNAAAIAGSTFGETDRNACVRVTLAATHAWLKGGNPFVPPQCHAMANVARAQIPLYAETHVSNANSAMEDLLSKFRPDLRIPLPGMTGIVPDAAQLREAECMQRIANAENCN